MEIKAGKKKILSLFLCVAIISTARPQEKSLEYFIDAALKNSPLLKDYNNQIQSNLIDSSRIIARYKPQVNAVSNNLYAPVINGWGYDEIITNLRNFSELITVELRRK